MPDKDAPKFKCTEVHHVGPWEYTMYGRSCKHCGYYSDD